MAIQGRWKPAAERYSTLIRIDKLDTFRQVVFDYEACGVILAKSPDPEAYERFWQMTVTNFAATPSSSILITCLLEPLNQQQLTSLKPMADHFAKTTFDVATNYVSDTATNRINQWSFMPLGLWTYRGGDYEGAIQWCDRGLAQKNKFPACDAELHIIHAMACYQCGQTAVACSELAQGRQTVAAKIQAGLVSGRAEEGYWFDWIYADILVREGETLMDCQPANSETE